MDRYLSYVGIVPSLTGSHGPIRVVVVDDGAHVRTLLTHRLPLEGPFEVVATGSTGREAIALALAYEPDLMILDVLMPELSGVDALPEIRRAAPRCRIVLFSALSDLGGRSKLGLGADAIVEKSAPFAELSAVLARLFPGRLEAHPSVGEGAS